MELAVILSRSQAKAKDLVSEAGVFLTAANDEILRRPACGGPPQDDSVTVILSEAQAQRLDAKH